MLFVLVDGLAVLGEVLLGFDDCGVGVADGVELLHPVMVLVLVHCGVVDRLFDLLVGELVVRGDRDALLFAGTEVFCGDVDDSVRIDVKSDLDLRDSGHGTLDAA